MEKVMIKTVCLNPLQPRPGDYPHHAAVENEILNLKKGQRVYRIYTRDPGGRCVYTFVTTAKDIHLELGLLSFGGLCHLIKLLEEEFDSGHSCSQLLLSIKSEKDSGAVLVTRTSRWDEEVTFTLSPTH